MKSEWNGAEKDINVVLDGIRDIQLQEKHTFQGKHVS